MIDFNNASYVKLRQVSIDSVAKTVSDIITDGENLVGAYKGVRDFVVFTNKRIITANVQGMTGKKIDYTSLPYKNISTYSIETSGVFDLDTELELWFSGLGKVRLEFRGSVDIKSINRVISQYTLE